MVFGSAVTWPTSLAIFSEPSVPHCWYFSIGNNVRDLRIHLIFDLLIFNDDPTIMCMFFINLSRLSNNLRILILIILLAYSYHVFEIRFGLQNISFILNHKRSMGKNEKFFLIFLVSSSISKCKSLRSPRRSSFW